jgi:outer membrane lipopolysaccharide assembly protein LptE/RlpB
VGITEGQIWINNNNNDIKIEILKVYTNIHVASICLYSYDEYGENRLYLSRDLQEEGVDYSEEEDDDLPLDLYLYKFYKLQENIPWE